MGKATYIRIDQCMNTFLPRGNGDDLHNNQFIYELISIDTSHTVNSSTICNFFFLEFSFTTLARGVMMNLTDA